MGDFLPKTREYGSQSVASIVDRAKPGRTHWRHIGKVSGQQYTALIASPQSYSSFRHDPRIVSSVMKATTCDLCFSQASSTYAPALTVAIPAHPDRSSTGPDQRRCRSRSSSLGIALCCPRRRTKFLLLRLAGHRACVWGRDRCTWADEVPEMKKRSRTSFYRARRTMSIK